MHATMLPDKTAFQLSEGAVAGCEPTSLEEEKIEDEIRNGVRSSKTSCKMKGCRQAR